MSEADRDYYLRNREDILAKRKAYRDANGDRIRESQRRYREVNRDRLAAWHRTPEAQERKGAVSARFRERAKADVFAHYGTVCTACGIDDPDVLTIDHIFGGGRKHRSEIGAHSSATAFYRWLVRNEFPGGFQTLCQNCNTKKYKQEQRGETFEPTRLPGGRPTLPHRRRSRILMRDRTTTTSNAVTLRPMKEIVR